MSKSRKVPPAGSHFIVVTGLSGSGKSQAIRALEDLGYYCVDNLPVSLLPVMAELSERQPDHNRVAVVMTAIEDTDVFEVSTPETDDVVRIEDRYGRS